MAFASGVLAALDAWDVVRIPGGGLFFIASSPLWAAWWITRYVRDAWSNAPRVNVSDTA